MDSLHEIITRHFDILNRIVQFHSLHAIHLRRNLWKSNCLANANDVYWLIVSPRTNDASQLSNRSHSFRHFARFTHSTTHFKCHSSYYYSQSGWANGTKTKNKWNIIEIEKCYNDRAPVQRLSRNSDIDDCRYSIEMSTHKCRNDKWKFENQNTKRTRNEQKIIHWQVRRIPNEWMYLWIFHISHFIESLKQNLNIELNVCVDMQ